MDTGVAEARSAFVRRLLSGQIGMGNLGCLCELCEQGLVVRAAKEDNHSSSMDTGMVIARSAVVRRRLS